MSEDAPRIAIATSSAGHGPVTAARNLARALLIASRGSAEVRIVNLPKATGAFADLLVNRAYNSSLRHGLVWNRVSVGVAFRLDWGRLGGVPGLSPPRIDPWESPPDALVFCTPWLAEAALRRRGPGVMATAVVLDLAPPLSPGWKAGGFDQVLAPTEEAASNLRDGAAVAGIPVFPAPTHGPPTVRCETCDGRPSALLMGGREGLSGILRLAKALSAMNDLHLDILVGHRRELLAPLKRIAAKAAAHVEAKAFVEDVLSEIASHDAVVAKPGTLTIGEALARGKPVVLDACAGLMPQEIGNARFVAVHHAGALMRSPAEAIAALRRVLENPEYVAAAKSLREIAGADRIASQILARTQEASP